MLKKLITILLSIFIISGCSDDHNVIMESNENKGHELVGIWDRRSTQSIMYDSGETETQNHTTDYLYIFSENGIFSNYYDSDNDGDWDSDVIRGGWWTTDNLLMIDWSGTNTDIYEYEINNNVLTLKGYSSTLSYINTYDKE